MSRYPWSPENTWDYVEPTTHTGSWGGQYTKGKSFLHKFATEGRFGVAGGMLDRARSAGYSDKQLAVAIRKNRDNLKIGDALLPGGQLHTQMATNTKGSPYNWIHNFQSPSGAVGLTDLKQGLGSGRTEDEFLAAGGMTAGGVPNWGIQGFGKDASAYLQNYLDEKAKMKEMQQQEQDLTLKEPDPVIIPHSKPATVAGASAMQQQGASEGRKRRGVKAQWGRSGAMFAMNLGAGGKSGSAGSGSQLNIA